MAARPQITLYVDVVSPFAYEAYYILRCGNTAPIFIKNKDNWIGIERIRWARAFGVPMRDNAPAGFPPMTLTAMRALSVVESLDGDFGQERLTLSLDTLFHKLWVEHEPIEKLEVLERVLCDKLGDDEARKVLEKVGTDGKTMLADNTNKAFADGAFGLPWIVCTNTANQREGFWGVDHLGQVVQFLGLEKPQDGIWKALL